MLVASCPLQACDFYSSISAALVACAIVGPNMEWNAYERCSSAFPASPAGLVIGTQHNYLCSRACPGLGHAFPVCVLL